MLWREIRFYDRQQRAPIFELVLSKRISEEVAFKRRMNKSSASEEWDEELTGKRIKSVWRPWGRNLTFEERRWPVWRPWDSPVEERWEMKGTRCRDSIILGLWIQEKSLDFILRATGRHWMILSIKVISSNLQHMITRHFSFWDLQY